MRRYSYREDSYINALDALIRKIFSCASYIALALLILKLCGTISIGYGVIASFYIVPFILEFMMDAIDIKVERIKKKKEEEEYKRLAEQYAMKHRTDRQVIEDE